MKICILASGSGGNSMYVESRGKALIIDQGISYRELLKRMASRGIDKTKIKSILVTHEHHDHVNGVGITARKLRVPIYATEGSLSKIREKLNGSEELIAIEGGVPFTIDPMEILPFSVSHDAVDPVQFCITSGRKKIAVATDLGFVSILVTERLKGCDLVVIEANYDVDMLREGPYLWALKKRIEGNKGHLSNLNAAETIFNLIRNGTPKVVLVHLSKENNRSDIAEKTVRELFEKYDKNIDFLIAASQNEATPVIEI